MTFLGSSSASFCCWKEKRVQLKGAQAEVVLDAARHVAADLFIQVDTLYRGVAVLKQSSKNI